MPIDYAKHIYNLTDDELERFVADWAASKMRAYLGGHERFSGPGDMGRDVVGYCTIHRFDGAWHNYQCKQLKRPLGTSGFFLELGKFFFIAPRARFPCQKACFLSRREGSFAMFEHSSRVQARLARASFPRGTSMSQVP
jgi:hypothetical protein